MEQTNSHTPVANSQDNNVSQDATLEPSNVTPITAAVAVNITIQEFADTIFSGMDHTKERIYTGPKDGKFPGIPISKMQRARNSAQYFLTATVAADAPDRAGASQELVYCIVMDDVYDKVGPNNLRPSWRLESSPGSQQWGYVFSEPLTLTDVARLMAQVKALEVPISDPGALTMPGRLARVPHGINGKKDPKTKVHAKHHDHQVRMLEWNPERTFSLEDLEAGWNLEPYDESVGVSGGVWDGGPGMSEAELKKLPELAHLTVLGTVPGKIFIECPNILAHTTENKLKDTCLLVDDSGRMGFSCLHGHCRDGAFDFDAWMRGKVFAGLPTPTPEQLAQFPSINYSAPVATPRVNVFGNAEPIGMDALTAEPTAPPVLLPGIIPVNVFGMVGPGGSSKTTMMLYIMIHIILEREIWGRMPERTGPCVFVSAEDDKLTMIYRVHRICKGMRLTDEEMQRVASMLYVHDVSGDIVRFVEADARGNLTQTTHVDELVNMYADKGVAITCFDPAVFFGAGERFVNDAEATLMQVGRRVSNRLDCAVGFIHHTSKDVARTKVTDQYAGRGGSAFADNSRALLVLHTLESTKDAPAVVPEEVTKKDIEQFRVAYLTVAKFSAGPRPELPFWWIRSEHDGFNFQTIEGMYLSPDERDLVKAEADEQKRYELVTAIYDVVVQTIAAGRYPNKTYLREMADIVVSNKKMGKTRISTGVEYCVINGFLEEEELPEGEKQGSRKYYLKPIKPPHLVGGGNTPPH